MRAKKEKVDNNKNGEGKGDILNNFQKNPPNLFKSVHDLYYNPLFIFKARGKCAVSKVNVAGRLYANFVSEAQL